MHLRVYSQNESGSIKVFHEVENPVSVLTIEHLASLAKCTEHLVYCLSNGRQITLRTETKQIGITEPKNFIEVMMRWANYPTHIPGDKLSIAFASKWEEVAEAFLNFIAENK